MLDLPNYEIAQRLAVTKKTVSIHIQHIRATLGIRDRGEIARHVRSEAAQE